MEILYHDEVKPFIKKTQKTPVKEIATAQKRIANFLTEL